MTPEKMDIKEQLFLNSDFLKLKIVCIFLALNKFLTRKIPKMKEGRISVAENNWGALPSSDGLN